MAEQPQQADRTDPGEAEVYWDRTRYVQYQKCPCQRWWATEYMGRGLQPAVQAEPLEWGIDFHLWLQHICSGQPASAVAEAGWEQTYSNALIRFKDHPDREVLALERAFITRGWLRLFALFILPRITREYRVIRVEAGGVLAHGPAGRFRYGYKPDILLQRLSDDSLWYWDWKSTGLNPIDWLASFEYDAQVHLAAYALGREFGKEIRGTIIQGFHKGRVDSKTQHISSPLHGGGVGPEGQPSLKRPDGWKGWKPSPRVWDTGQDDWLARFTEAEWSSVLPQSPPIFLREDMAETIVRQAEVQEGRIAHYRSWTHEAQPNRDIMLRVFPQHFHVCDPPVGYPCEFKRLCWEPEAGENPLEAGFKWREAHHPADPIAEAEDGMA